MRRLILKTEVSLDGFMEGPGGAMDWFATNDGQGWKELFRLLADVDTVIMGRGMYPGYSSYWRAVLAEPAKHSKDHLRYARFADKTPHIVFSRTMKRTDWDAAAVNGGQLKAEVGKLKRRRGGDLIVYGGAAFASALVDAGLVDEYQLVVHPVILGGGKALFGGVHRRLRLRLLWSKTLRSGVVLLRYGNGAGRAR